MTQNNANEEPRPAKPTRCHKKETPGKETERRDRANMIAASQFAYTLVIGTFFMGWFGKWLGTKLGGAPGGLILMFLFGSLAFAGEMYRMYAMFSPPKNKDTGKEEKSTDRDALQKNGCPCDNNASDGKQS